MLQTPLFLFQYLCHILIMGCCDQPETTVCAFSCQKMKPHSISSRSDNLGLLEKAAGLGYNYA